MKQMLRNLKKQTMAVSPVVATLMLVLVSVGSAGAFYVWQSGWQGDIQLTAGNENEVAGQATLTIDGSSTVYEFSKVAAEMFEGENPEVDISVTYTGSGAGRLGASKGYCDIGSASSPTDPDDWPIDLDRDGNEDRMGELLVTTVAMDGVTMITYNIGGSSNINKDDLTALYLCNLDYWTTADVTAYGPSTTPAAGNEYTVGDFGWTSTGTGATIGVGFRSEKSGTQEAFCSAATDIKSETGDKQLNKPSDYIEGSEDVSGRGNQDVMDNLLLQPNPMLTFTSLSLADGTSNIQKLTFEGVEATEGNIASGDYKASRPLQYLTIDLNEDGELDNGLAKQYIEFCLIPEVNEDVCEEAGYTSLFA